MVRFFRCPFVKPSRKLNVTVLALSLLFGYLLGSFCAGYAESDLFLLMRTGAMSSVSIVCLLPVLFLPFLCSAIAVYLGWMWLLIPIAFLKAFLFSYLCGHILALFPVSGQLFAVLFMLPDVLSLPVLCWFWIHSICTARMGCYEIMAVILSIAGIGLLNYQFISPFLASLLS